MEAMEAMVAMVAMEAMGVGVGVEAEAAHRRPRKRRVRPWRPPPTLPLVSGAMRVQTFHDGLASRATIGRRDAVHLTSSGVLCCPRTMALPR